LICGFVSTLQFSRNKGLYQEIRDQGKIGWQSWTLEVTARRSHIFDSFELIVRTVGDGGILPVKATFMASPF
jgi:hypothetical protein